MKVVMCGSRDWLDGFTIGLVLNGLAVRWPRLEIIHGDARGADSVAARIATALLGESRVHAFPADWRTHGKAAGPIRNRVMLEQRPKLVVAFKDHFDHTLRTGGTENMIKIAQAAGIKTMVVCH